MNYGRIDYQALAELKEMLEDEFVELVETYVRDTHQKLTTLTELSPPQDADEVRKVAHSLKGASINLGLLRLGEICLALEAQAKDNIIRDYEQHLEEIQAEVDFVFGELQRL
ncbi:Hpt domain-containing protein [Reinekea blandensis]|uniref:Hpt domain protein n=1 Tax=Reinekea blandensis MED297 TaxID=314283 RepID=A4BIN8_9GAMM|nr:Hpt domain-containing protein [Reinekea blandensis]EAR08002.1 Hpt domain protein [Reinekea sp. MED297] [Reinekea blandensis MED297]